MTLYHMTARWNYGWKSCKLDVWPLKAHLRIKCGPPHKKLPTSVIKDGASTALKLLAVSQPVMVCYFLDLLESFCTSIGCFAIALHWYIITTDWFSEVDQYIKRRFTASNYWDTGTIKYASFDDMAEIHESKHSRFQNLWHRMHGQPTSSTLLT